MTEPRLEMFDLGNLVSRLNAALSDREEVIELGEFEHKEPRKNPFLYSLADREMEARGKFPLRQTVYNRGILGGILGLDSEINLGYIFVESGYINASSSECLERYETLRLRIKQPLKLKHGLAIPNCSIKLLRESEEQTEPHQNRRDHVRYAGLVWVRTDLSKVLPSEWFFPQPKALNHRG